VEGWLLLTLLSAFLLAAADTLTKKFLFDYSGWELVAIRFVTPAILLLPFAAAAPLPPVPAAFWGWIALLLPLEFVAMFLYMLAIRDSPLHLTLPYLAFTPVFNVLTAWLLLGETVSVHGLFGILLVVGGAYALHLETLQGGPGRGLAWLAPLRAIVRERGSRRMLVAASIYSLTSVMSKRVMLFATPLSFGVFYVLALGGGFLVIALLLWRGTALRLLVRRPVPHFLVGVLMAAMIVIHFVALSRVEVAYMIAVKRSSLLFGILFGAIWFGERNLGQHVLAGAAMVAGVALIVS